MIRNAFIQTLEIHNDENNFIRYVGFVKKKKRRQKKATIKSTFFL